MPPNYSINTDARASVVRCMSLAARANVKTVVMTHTQPSPNNDYSRYVDEVKKHYSGQVLVAKDLMEF